MESHVRATEAARRFSDLLNRIRYRGESFVIERGGEPVCRLGPVAPARRTLGELAAVLRSLRPPDTSYLDAVERATRRQPRLPRDTWRSSSTRA
jgi:antitoxin (DNA-binding transcriptional repressor) of toxin-antitoxin stability system